MTLLVSWISKDDKPQGKETSALYIGSDSRYSWSPLYRKYDDGPKTFACQSFPDIFGFCGDVTFCVAVISQLTGLIDRHCLFSTANNVDDKIRKVREFIEGRLSSYPKDRLTDFVILHGTRVEKEFALTSFSYSAARRDFSYKRENMPETSNKVFIGGSGGPEFLENWISADGERENNSKTSRNIFHCLDHTLRNIKDVATGGEPQAVGIYRGGNARTFGIIREGKRVIGGTEVEENLNLNNIEWRNSDFERMDPESLSRIEDAQRHYF